jgi:hypothetical protein
MEDNMEVEETKKTIEGPDLWHIMGDEIATLNIILKENVKSLESRIWALLTQSCHMTSYGVENNLHETISALDSFKHTTEYVCEHFKEIVHKKYEVLKNHRFGKNSDE